MKRFSAKTHIALGQSFLLATVLIMAMFLGLIPDRESALREGRAALAEAVAATGSGLSSMRDLSRLETTLRFVVERNEDLLSAALRRIDGEVLLGIGDHDAHWNPGSGDLSDSAQITVPIFASGQRFGQVELRFQALGAAGWRGIVDGANTRLIGFVTLVAFAMFYFYLGRVLRHLDPSRAVPPHVRSALDTLAEGLMVLDLQQNIVLANQSFCAIVGGDRDALVGRRADHFAWRDGEGVVLASDALPWVRALRDGEPLRNELMILRGGDGLERSFHVNCSPVLGDAGKAGGVLISLDDVTLLEQSKAELARSKDQADRANRAKSDFLANMSHEIRTPMNAILGFTEVLRRGLGRSRNQQEHYLDTIHSSGKHLLQLINDVLDLSKVESGRLEIEQIDFAPHRVIGEVIEVLRVKADEKAIGLRLEATTPVPEQVCGDPTRLRQIVTNLISNAVKFTDLGEVLVQLALDRGPAGTRLVVKVADSGVGIPGDRLESIFEPFVQADSSVTRKFGGTGLGLAISRDFARLMGGDIVATSRPGEGSVFIVTLDPGPLDDVDMLAPDELARVAQAGVAQAGVTWRFPPKRVLVTDDGVENRELVRLVLEEVGLVVEEAENGAVAVAMVPEGNYDVVLMDMQMPVMDGYTATGRLREMGSQVPIFALTANAMKGFEQACLDAGCTGYMTKPVDIDAMLATLAELLGAEAVHGASAAAEAPTAPAPTPEVADEPSPPAAPDAAGAGAGVPVAAPAEPLVSRLAEPLVSRLAGRGPRFEATITRFVERLGERMQALQAAAAAGDLEALADLAHWLKGAAGTVGFDGFTVPAEKLEAAARGGDSDAVAALVATLHALASRVVAPDGTAMQGATLAPASTDRAPGAAMAGEGAAAPSPAEPDATGAAADVPVAAPAAPAEPLVSRLAGRGPRFEATITRFVERLGERMQALQSAAAAGDLEALADLAHWLKGAAGTVGFDGFTVPAEKLEAAARGGESDAVAALVATLHALAARVVAPDGTAMQGATLAPAATHRAPGAATAGEGAATPSPAAPDATPSPAAPDATGAAANVPVAAPAALAEPLVSRLAGRGPRFEATITRFVERLGERMQALQSAAAAGDLEALADLAHWLKGAAGTVGFDGFTVPAEKLEAAARGGDSDAVPALVEALHALASRVVAPGPAPARPGDLRTDSQNNNLGLKPRNRRADSVSSASHDARVEETLDVS